MALLALRQPLGRYFAIAQLYGVVAVGLLILHLGHKARPGLNDGHRRNNAAVIKDLSHADFLSYQSFHD